MFASQFVGGAGQRRERASVRSRASLPRPPRLPGAFPARRCRSGSRRPYLEVSASAGFRGRSRRRRLRPWGLCLQPSLRFVVPTLFLLSNRRHARRDFDAENDLYSFALTVPFSRIAQRIAVRISTSSRRRRLSTEGRELLELRFITGTSQGLGIHCALAAGSLMVHIATNPPSGPGRQSLSMSREAVPNLIQCVRVGTDRGKGIPAGRNTLQWTAGMRK